MCVIITIELSQPKPGILCNRIIFFVYLSDSHSSLILLLISLRFAYRFSTFKIKEFKASFPDEEGRMSPSFNHFINFLLQCPFFFMYSAGMEIP